MKPKAIIPDASKAKAQARIDAENVIAAHADWSKTADALRKIVKRAVLGASSADLAPNRLGLTPFELLLVERLSDIMLRAMLPGAIKAISRSAARRPRTPDLSAANYADVCRAYDDLRLTSSRNEIHAVAWKIAGKALGAARKKGWGS